MSMSTITTETRGRLFLIGLNRPAKYNAFNRAMLRELSEAYSLYEKSEQLRCAVLFAHGDNFTSGLDLADVGPAVAAGEELFPSEAIDPVDLRAPRRTKPVVIAVHGWCLTIGLELLLASDIRVAARGTRMAQIEIKRGIMPFGGATLRLPQIVGWGNAMRYLLTGDEISAEEAYRMGIVQEITEPGAQLDAAVAIAERISAQAPLGVKESRTSSRIAVEQGTDAALSRLMDQARSLMKSDDAAEGLRSFVERRDADFKGR